MYTIASKKPLTLSIPPTHIKFWKRLYEGKIELNNTFSIIHLSLEAPISST